MKLEFHLYTTTRTIQGMKNDLKKMSFIPFFNTLTVRYIKEGAFIKRYGPQKWIGKQSHSESKQIYPLFPFRYHYYTSKVISFLCLALINSVFKKCIHLALSSLQVITIVLIKTLTMKSISKCFLYLLIINLIIQLQV